MENNEKREYISNQTIPKEELKNHFKNGDIPSQEDFWQWQDSYWHKNDSADIIPSERVDMSNKADKNATNLDGENVQSWRNKLNLGSFTIPDWDSNKIYKKDDLVSHKIASIPQSVLSLLQRKISTNDNNLSIDNNKHIGIWRNEVENNITEPDVSDWEKIVNLEELQLDLVPYVEGNTYYANQLVYIPYNLVGGSVGNILIKVNLASERIINRSVLARISRYIAKGLPKEIDENLIGKFKLKKIINQADGSEFSIYIDSTSKELDQLSRPIVYLQDFDSNQNYSKTTIEQIIGQQSFPIPSIEIAAIEKGLHPYITLHNNVFWRETRYFKLDENGNAINYLQLGVPKENNSWKLLAETNVQSGDLSPSGDFIPLSGTLAIKPVTGGITGSKYFIDNYIDNSFTQKKYVDDSVKGITIQTVLDNDGESENTYFQIRQTSDSANYLMALYSDKPSNTKQGQFVIFKDKDGYLNVYSALRSTNPNQPSKSTYYGYQSLKNYPQSVTTTETNLSAYGYYAGYHLKSGNNNNFLGNSSGLNISEGSNNTIIGSFKFPANSTLNNEVVISDGSASKIAFRTTGLGLTTIPQQTKTEYDRDTTGKAIVTKEIISTFNAYSNSEIKTGRTWIDGKPIYRKVINNGDSNPTNVNIIIKRTNTEGGSKVYSILEYTKTTD